MSRRLILICLMAFAVVAPPAAAISPSALERKLARSDLYVEPGTAGDLSAAERRRLTGLLAEERGRIKLAVVDPAVAPSLEALGSYANQVADYANGRDRRIGAGLFVLAGLNGHFVVSARTPDDAVERDYKGRTAGIDDTFIALRAAVSAIKQFDPGPQPAEAPPGGEPFGSLDDAVDDVAGVAKGVLITIAATFVGVVALIISIFVVRAARRRRAAERAGDLVTGDARRELLELGEAIRLFDLDVSMPGADPGGVSAYHAAVERYDRARAILDRDEPDPFELARARSDVADGLRHMQSARDRLSS